MLAAGHLCLIQVCLTFIYKLQAIETAHNCNTGRIRMWLYARNLQPLFLEQTDCPESEKM